MGNIYRGQTALDIEVTVGVNITGATCKVKYRKPSGIVGSFSANITDAVNGIIVASPSTPDDLDQAGTWSFWGYVTFADGKVAAGEPVSIQIYEEGYIVRS